jgi:hypothetical protein
MEVALNNAASLVGRGSRRALIVFLFPDFPISGFPLFLTAFSVSAFQFFSVFFDQGSAGASPHHSGS